MKKKSKYGHQNPLQMTDIPKVLENAMSLFRSGNITEAGSLYQEILQCNPQHPVALHFMGMVAFQAGDYKSALDLTGKSIEANPNNPHCLYHRGIIYNAQDDLLAAVDSYRQAIALSPHYTHAYFNLGYSLFELSKKTIDNKVFLDEAETCLRKVLNIQPSVDAYKNLAIILQALGKRSEALELSKFTQIDWESEIKNLTAPILLIDGLILNRNETPQDPLVERQVSCLKKQEMPDITPFPFEALKEPSLQMEVQPDAGITKKLKIVLIYPPPWQILQPGEAPLGTPFDPPKDLKYSVLNEDARFITYGLLTLAAQAKRSGHDVSIHNLSVTPWQEVKKLIAETKVDIYGISVFTANRRGMGAVAALIRQYYPKTHITVGGPFATALPVETLKFYRDIDTVVIGEGEETFRELLEHIGSGHPTVGIPGTAWRNGEDIIVGPKRQRIKDLDALSSPFDYFTSSIVITSRGCPGKCTFCASSTTWGKRLTFHSVDYCLDMFKKALAQLSLPFLQIKDDTFTADRRRAIAICDAIIENKINFLWSCDTRVDYIDEELLRKMRLAGCQTISFGVESGSPKILKNMRKKTTPEMILEATRIARKYGFYIQYYMILLSKGETLETINQSTALIKAGQPNFYTFCALAFHPGTEDYEILSKEQNISEEIFFRNDFLDLRVTLNREMEVRRLLEKVVCDIGIRNGFGHSIEEREAVVDRLPNLHAAHVDLANLYFRAGRLDEATAELNLAEELSFPIDIIIKNQRACIALAKNDPETALALLENGLKSSSCNVVEKNYNKLKKWANMPTYKRGKPPVLFDEVNAMSFVR